MSEMTLSENVYERGMAVRVTVQRDGDDVLVRRYAVVRGEILNDSVRLTPQDVAAFLVWWEAYGKASSNEQ